MENLKKFVETANKDGIKVEAVILKQEDKNVCISNNL